jgi:hypothetical protein
MILISQYEISYSELLCDMSVDQLQVVVTLCTNIPHTGPLFGLSPCDTGGLICGCVECTATAQLPQGSGKKNGRRRQ